MNLSALRIADDPDRWRALGFELHDAAAAVGAVTLELGAEGSGITAWAVDGLLQELDGLQRFEPADAQAPSDHVNGAIAIDQVVVLTPNFDRTAQALEQHEIPLKRVRDGGGFRQGFRRLGPAILELVEARNEDQGKPARFWGLVVIVPDLHELKEQLGELLGTPTNAVQAGRQIAVVRRGAGLSTRLAFMTPEPG
ncbi:MAG: hypothetical protein JOZ73_00080 [Solirubrobacterales bacterium]|nr:hypothetical protein [Solirubrobacterales bacterium]